MAIKIEMLRSFCAVAQSGSLSAAADRLGRTQSALSMTLKQLEDHLGKPLFAGERKNQLSPLGEQVYVLAATQVRQFDETLRTIDDVAKADHGLIRIVSVPSVAAMIFPQILEHMTNRFPDLKIEMRDTDSQQVLEALVLGKAEIGIASGLHALNGIEAETLFDDSFGLVCAADHPLNLQDPLPTIDEVVEGKFIRNALCDLIETPHFRSAADGVNVTIHNTHSLLSMIRTGNWVTVLPQSVVSFSPDAIAFRPIAGLPDKRRACLYVKKEPRFPRMVEECCRFIRSCDIG
ncbi:LysR family transcriptional regulator [Ruegeria sp.]|uniref:LysR family transcriptional regulator n=1 Tax=Ruegeria sp. TaxID=1879320 RepID=UPI003B5C48B1